MKEQRLFLGIIFGLVIKEASVEVKLAIASRKDDSIFRFHFHISINSNLLIQRWSNRFGANRNAEKFASNVRHVTRIFALQKPPKMNDGFARSASRGVDKDDSLYSSRSKNSSGDELRDCEDISMGG